MALFPTMYLSGGTCTTLIMIGGGTMKTIFEIMCGDACHVTPPTVAEWYWVFACAAMVLSQLPNLNSMARVSLIGAITAISYCTVIWVVSVVQGKPAGVSYEPVEANSEVAKLCNIFNALGIIAFAFRGHNVILEIQVKPPYSCIHLTLKMIVPRNRCDHSSNSNQF